MPQKLFSSFFLAPIIGLSIMLWGLGACKSVGPRTIPPDGFNYNAQIAVQNKEQMLVNIIRLRYGEMPHFLNLNSMISQYTLQGNASLGGTFSSGPGVQSGNISGTWADKPTITYSPLSGQAFTRNLMTPVPPSAIFFLIQSGWPVGVIMRLTTNSINGLNNESSSPRVRREGDPEFYLLLDLLETIRMGNALGMRLSEQEKNPSIDLFFPENLANDTIQNAIDQAKQLLGLPADQNSFPIYYGLIVQDNDEIRMQTKSMLEILNSTAWYIDVPPDHIAEGRTFTTFNSSRGRLLNVLFTRNKPDDAFVAVNLRKYWYYIDDRDLPSKTNFAIVQILMSLTNDVGNVMSPLISIGN